MGRGLSELQVAIMSILEESSEVDPKELVYLAYRKLGKLTPKGTSLTESQFSAFRRSLRRLEDRGLIECNDKVGS